MRDEKDLRDEELPTGAEIVGMSRELLEDVREAGRRMRQQLRDTSEEAKQGQ